MTGERVFEVLGNVLDTEVLLDVLLPGFFLSPIAGVDLLKPDKGGWVCDGVLVGMGGLGILCMQLVNVGRGSRSEVIARFAFDKAPLCAQYFAYRARA